MSGLPLAADSFAQSPKCRDWDRAVPPMAAQGQTDTTHPAAGAGPPEPGVLQRRHLAGTFPTIPGVVYGRDWWFARE
jgi:hypothetical protein